MSFEIQSNVPIPPNARQGGRGRYPFAAMQPGDSFFVPESEGSAKNLGSAMYCWKRTLPSGEPKRVFVTRTVKNPDGARIWRIS